MVLLPGILLNYLGISYTHLGGAPWEKLHPSTYIALLALLIASTSRTDPVHFLLTMARQESRVMIYLGAVAIIAGVTVVTEGIGELGFLVDTLLLPAVVVIVLKVTPPAQQRQIYWVLLWLVVGNALLGIGETAVNQQLIPPTNADGTPFIDAQFRPWALCGHPLNNALITGNPVQRRLR